MGLFACFAGPQGGSNDVSSSDTAGVRSDQNQELQDTRHALKKIQAELDLVKKNAASQGSSADENLLSELRSRVQALEKENQELAASGKQSAMLQQKSREANTVASETAAEIKTLKISLDEALSEAQRKADELDRVNQQLAATEMASAAAAREVADLKEKSAAAEKSLATVKTSSAQAETQLSQMTKKLEAQEAALAAHVAQMVATSEKVDALQKQLAEKSEAFSILETELAKSQAAASRGNELKDELLQVNKERDTLQSELKLLLAEHSAASAKRGVDLDRTAASSAAATAAAAAAGEEAIRLKKKVEDLEGETKVLKESLERSNLERAAIEAAHTNLLADASNRQHRLAEMEAKMSEASAALASLQQESEKSKLAADEQLQAATVKSELATTQIRELEMRLVDLQKENGRLNDSLAASGAADAALAAMQLMVTRLETEKGFAEEKLRSKEIELSTLTSEHKQLQERLSDLDTEAASHTAISEATSDQAHQLLLDYQQLKEKHLALIHETKIKDDMMELLQQQLSELADMDLDKILMTAMPTGGRRSKQSSRGGAAAGAGE